MQCFVFHATPSRENILKSNKENSALSIMSQFGSNSLGQCLIITSLRDFLEEIKINASRKILSHTAKSDSRSLESYIQNIFNIARVNSDIRFNHLYYFQFRKADIFHFPKIKIINSLSYTHTPHTANKENRPVTIDDGF